MCIILLYITSIKSYAVENDVNFSLNSLNAQRKDEITIVVNMDCINSFAAANFVLSYDASVLEYVPYLNENNGVDFNQNCGTAILTQSGAPIGTIAINSATAGTIKIGYMSTNSVAGKNGEFLKFKFNVKDDAKYGDSSISLSTTTLKSAEGNDLTPEFADGKVSILSDISMNKDNLEMNIEDEEQLSISTSNGTIIDEVVWTSSDTDVLEIVPGSDTKTATITAVAPGTATVTATVGGVTTTCDITVAEPEIPYSISISNPSWSFLPVTQIRSLSATFDPVEQGEGKTITWSSSDENVATINSATGEITAVSEGTTVITATDGNERNTYTLTVSGLLGDIDNDSRITSYDAYRALVLYGNQDAGYEINQDEVVVLDVERNGNMSSNDAYLILKYSVGLISSFN